MTDSKPPNESSQRSSSSGNTTTSSSNKPALSSDGDSTDFIPGNTLTTRFRNFYRMATGSMSPPGQKAYWHDADIRNEKGDCLRCETRRDYLLRYSPIIRFLRDNVQKLGGDLGPHNIRCRRCETRMEGGFDPEYGVLICANHVQSRKKVEDVMAHEMTHAYDHLRFKVDWEGKTAGLKALACTEIRASNLSGECRWANEFFGNRVLAFTNHHQDCVRRRAILSVRSRPQCPDDVAAVKAVNDVWDSCFRDTRPFDEIYR